MLAFLQPEQKSEIDREIAMIKSKLEDPYHTPLLKSSKGNFELVIITVIWKSNASFLLSPQQGIIMVIWMDLVNLEILMFQ